MNNPYAMESAVVAAELQGYFGALAEPLARTLVLGAQAGAGDELAQTLLARTPTDAVKEALFLQLGWEPPQDVLYTSQALLVRVLAYVHPNFAVRRVLEVLNGIVVSGDIDTSYALAFRDHETQVTEGT